MTETNPARKFRLILLLAVFLLLCSGAQSTFACLLSGNQSYSYSIRVDSCHLVVSQKESTPCCQIEACHQSAIPHRDLGSPEYHTLQKGSPTLIHESRPLTAQLKVGEPFVSQHIVLPHLSSSSRSQRPLQSLHSLRTIVLLN